VPQSIPSDQLDLALAWRRAIEDLAARRAFVRHPFLDSLIATDVDSWLTNLSQQLTTGTFRPASCRIVPIPKPLGQIRPGADLRLIDQVVYAALLQAMREPVTSALGSSAGSVDYSYQLRSDPAHVEWFEPFFPRWQAFDRDSVQAIDDGAQFVVVADVAGYYENIDLNTLRSDLNGLAVDAAPLSLLMECLHRWARVQRRGVPQGHGPSDILAKLYMRAVDLTLVAEGFQHRRWVDDVRVFCRTLAEARKALVLLSDALGRRGLVLQSNKSNILDGEVARAKFSMVRTLLDPINANVALQLRADGGSEPSYLPPWEVDAALSAAGAEGAAEVLRTAFRTYFLTPGAEFNKSLFHYLLRRLAAAHDRTYGSEIIALLRVLPEEFDYIAAYCSAVQLEEAFEAEFLASYDEHLLPYPFVTYQFLRWRIRQERPLSTHLKTFSRTHAFQASNAWFVRSLCRALLGKLGDPTDLEQLEAAYPDAQSSVERAEILCCVQRMEVGRRNALFGRAAGDGLLASRAVRLARAGTINWHAC
jgi:hypothetical protein